MSNDIKQRKNGEGTRRVIIVGAGPVGLFLAYKLGRAGISVIVLEKNENVSDAPRAVGYYAASALALHDAGLYSKIREEGFMVKGLCWRKKPVDEGNGGKRLGDIIAAQPLVADMTETNIPVGAGLLSLPQGRLTRLFLREALATGNVKVHFQRELREIEQDNACAAVTVTTKVLNGRAIDEEQKFVGEFLVGADGARSATRKVLKLPFPGHTWPERLLATDVVVRNVEDHVYHCHYILDQVNFTVSTPLTEPIMGEKSLWRYTMALDTSDARSDEEVLTNEYISELYNRVMAGPRPLEYEVQNTSVYRIHQRLAPTLRRGRAVLAGDAAHVCNPFGALGLNTGLLDADALYDALSMIMDDGKPLSVLDVYSDERRKVFQNFVDPTSTYNKLRIHCLDQDTVATDDWYFRALQNPSPETIQEAMRPYFDTWRTNLRKVVAKRGL